MDQKYITQHTVKNPPDVVCSITGQLMTDPVILMQTGNTYEREAILSWLKKKKSDPLTNQSITDETIAPNDTLKRMISAQQDKQNALIDYLLRGDLDGAKRLESEGASFLYRNKHGLYPLVAGVYGTNLEALRYIEGKLKKEEAELQWSEVYVERAKKEIASELPRELRAGATQRELAEWYENSGLEKMQGLYNALCLKIEGFGAWDSLGGCESFLGRAAWTRKQGRSWNDPPNIDLTIMDSACRSGRGNLFLPSRSTHDAVVNQIRNQNNELKKLVETKVVKQPAIDETIAPNDTPKRMIFDQQDKQNALIDYLLRGDLEGAKQSESEGASFLYRNKQGLYPLVAAVYGTNLEALRYIEGKLKKEEAELQWSEVYVERAKKEIASEMPRELRTGATQRELAEWYENSGLEKMQGLYNALCLKIEGFDKWDSLGGCESFWGRAAWTRKQGRSWNDPPNIDLTIMDRACQSGRGNLFLPSRWTHDAVVNQIRNQINELKKLVETKAVKQPVIMDEKSARFTKNSFENQKEKYLCPISYQIMAEPVTASDGHVYEKEKIEALLAHSSNPISPLTREALNKNHPLVVNLWMRGEIANFLEENQGLLSDDDVYLPEKWKSGFANAIRNRNEDQYNEWVKKERRLKEIELEPNKTALELVCERGTPELVKKVILDLGIEKVREKILSKNKTREDNAFYLAWSSNGWEVLKLLIEKLDLSHGDIEFLEFHKVVKKPVYLDDLFLKSAQNGNIIAFST